LAIAPSKLTVKMQHLSPRLTCHLPHSKGIPLSSLKHCLERMSSLTTTLSLITENTLGGGHSQGYSWAAANRAHPRLYGGVSNCLISLPPLRFHLTIRFLWQTLPQG